MVPLWQEERWLRTAQPRLLLVQTVLNGRDGPGISRFKRCNNSDSSHRLRSDPGPQGRTGQEARAARPAVPLGGRATGAASVWVFGFCALLPSFNTSLTCVSLHTNKPSGKSRWLLPAISQRAQSQRGGASGRLCRPFSPLPTSKGQDSCSLNCLLCIVKGLKMTPMALISFSRVELKPESVCRASLCRFRVRRTR